MVKTPPQGDSCVPLLVATIAPKAIEIEVSQMGEAGTRVTEGDLVFQIHRT